MTPATWPLASVPRSVRPSTMLARSIIGVFAAMITCVQVSSWLRFIARPSATMSRQDEPDIFWNAIACPIDRRSLPSEPPPMSWSASGVRSTRCGTPSSTDGDDGVRDGPLQVLGLHRVRHRAVAGQQEPGAHRDARGTVSERGHEAAPVAEPAGADHRQVDRGGHLRQQNRRGDAAGVAAALAALRDHGVHAPRRDLLRVPPGADRRHDDQPVVLERLDHPLVRCQRERGNPDPVLDQQRSPFGQVRGVAAHVHAERLAGQLRGTRYR